MGREFPPRRSFESLRKEARRWLTAVRDGVADARDRLARALPRATDRPSLRTVQHALARERGFPGWTALKRALAPNRSVSATTLARYDVMASALLEAFRSGTPDAMERHYRYTWHRRSWPAMRAYVLADLGKRPSAPRADVDITLDDARYLVAAEHGFENWRALETFVSTMPGGTHTTAKPVRVRSLDFRGEQRLVATTRDWQTIVRLLVRATSPALDAQGQMTDAMLLEASDVSQIVGLDLSGSRTLTDEGLRNLAGLPNLRHLALGGTAITDRGLGVLQELTNLESVSLASTRVTDAGVAHLTRCDGLRRVDLSHTSTGDDAIRALAGKPRLSHFRSGNRVTDEGIRALHDWPVFKTWHGGEPTMALLSYDAGPNYLLLRGAVTDRGLRSLEGLDGLFALNLDDRALHLSATGIEALKTLPRLGWLAVDAKNEWMKHIAELPSLRFLGAQDTPADDEGFVALSRSRSIEYLWGRRCHNLRRRGFLALADMPALRGLSVSCLNVDDAGVSAIPRFPALRELMPMDIPDAGYRHIAKCEALESLVLMYCRDTTDAATEHLTSLRKLSSYFNSYTAITDRTPELLSGIDSLEQITFDACHNLTDAGIARLARLPSLKELRVSGRGVTATVGVRFPSSVLVNPEE